MAVTLHRLVLGFLFLHLKVEQAGIRLELEQDDTKAGVCVPLFHHLQKYAPIYASIS